MAPSPATDRHPASFRDPDGFIFHRDGVLLRQVNAGYREHYEALMGSGLYRELADRGDLVSHEEDGPAGTGNGVFKVLRPQVVPFISFPYEWCFGQLKDAALLTLGIQERALEKGMVLKDASAYNIQFHLGRPIHIDTLSFEKRREGEPWVAYAQFCRHFLAPLALMAGRDPRLGLLSRDFIDGVPLDLAAKLLPASSMFRPGQLLHIHLHARSQRTFAGRTGPAAGPKGAGMGLKAMIGLVQSLRSAVEGLSLQRAATEWGDYYQDNSYSQSAIDGKKAIVSALLAECRPSSVWDLGANSGLFSRLASNAGIPTVSFDLDTEAVEANYRECRKAGETHLLPLLLDLTNPSPALGWDNRERPSLAQRGPADAVMALALVHHLAISNNLPLERIAEYFAGLGRNLIIEFVPKEDVQVRRLLSTRRDIFPDYHEQAFVEAFSRHFRIKTTRPVPESPRRLFLMERSAP